MTYRSKGRAWIGALAVTALLAGCGGTESHGPSSRQPAPHGHVAGAEETAEPQWRLLVAETGSGAMHALDPALGKAAAAGTVRDLKAITTDGRFAYLLTGNGLRIFDSGVWTVDHGDHMHYYRTGARMLGTLPGPAGTAPDVTGDPALTALSSRDGVRVLDRKALDTGKTVEPVKVSGRIAVPYAEHLLVASAQGGRVAVHDRTGRRVSLLPESCPDPRGQAVTRRGAVIGCSDGALLTTESEGAFTAEKIAYPGAVAESERAVRFRHRPGSAVLAAVAGDKGAWVLDLSAKRWRRVGSGAALAVNATGEDSPVLVLGEDGRLRAYDPASGKETASRRVISEPGDAAPVIEVDTARAYVNDPAGRAVHEIDYNDDLRLARTFDLPIAPDHMVETGW